MPFPPTRLSRGLYMYFLFPARNLVFSLPNRLE